MIDQCKISPDLAVKLADKFYSHDTDLFNKSLGYTF